MAKKTDLYFKFKVGDRSYLLTQEKLAVLVDMLDNCDYLEQQWTNNIDGNDKSGYVDNLVAGGVAEVSLPAIPASFVDTLRLATKV